MTNTRNRRGRAIDQVADRIDLTIDLMTLGQYGLERAPDDEPGERCDPHRTDWEATRQARRRGSCERDWRTAAPAWTAGACA